jgi:arabinan endo-1,5-alpha-L-arabinosidase
MRCKLTSAPIIAALCALAVSVSPAMALDGMLNIHDPSTIIVCDGSYYVYGTGRGIPILTSTDGFTWKRSGHVFDQIPSEVVAVVPNHTGNGIWAPDVLKVSNRYYLYYAVSVWGSFESAIGLMTNSTLNPASPNYKWVDGGLVVNSAKGEDLNAIDPCPCQAPDGTLWLSYGSYHGKIRLVQLNPQTGGRIAPNSPTWNIASKSEASYVMHHGDYFYLMVNHGSCCQGKNSTYNIRMGRSTKVTGPYLDQDGKDLLDGAGSLFLASAGTQIGPGQFGRLMDDGVEKFSCHFEADTSKGGRAVLDIRPLLWTPDGWPAPGENVKDGTYQIRSKAAAAALQVATPTEGTPVEIGKYLAQDSQQWTFTAAGGGFYKITGAKSGKALEVADADKVNIGTYTGADNQLWKVDQISDGSYRLESKINRLALTAMAGGGASGRVLAKDFTADDTQRWLVTAP